MNESYLKKNWYKRPMCILTVIVLLCSILSIPAYAEEQQERVIVRVGFAQYPGFHMQDENGIKSGYGYDLLQTMKIYENWNYEYVGYDDGTSWGGSLKLLEEDKIDLLTSAVKTEKRLEQYAYSDIPVGYSSTMLTVKAGDSRFDTEDYSNWNGIKIGTLAGTIRLDALAQYAAEHGFTYETVEFE